jgi:hypothetical protein
MKSLLERLHDAQGVLDAVGAALGRKPGVIGAEAEAGLRALVGSRSDIAHWVTIVGARDAAWDLLYGLEDKADPDDLVPFGDGRAKFVHVRLIGVQAYVATSWALADCITGMAGRLLCTPEASRNGACPAQLISHFVQKERKKTTAGALYESLRRSFGWPVGLFYAIRNHFVHDGAQINGSDFFEAPTAASGFRISDEGWSRIEKTVQNRFEVDASHSRAGATWPVNPCDDLRVILRVCERETDDALGVILGSACGTLLSHVGFMLGED